MNIGDIILRLLADGSQLEQDVTKEAQKAGDAGAKTMGARLSSGLKTNGLRAFSAVAAGVFTGMTKGALELQDVQARFQAETGASADEAAHAAKVINKAAGDNRLSLTEVADAAAKVHNDLGLVGDAADKATEKFAEYARVTNQQAGAAVSAFDDILDNWGLTAADANVIMDKLIVSHQKFGGSIDETQKTLAALAPSLRAANFEIDDGIALLGLFGAKGLDAGVASAAFSKALTKVKSPQELKDLIKDIAATKDPFERASKAADLFGAKAGAKLANALDGVDLDSYKIGLNEAAGATDKAAAALDSGFGNQFKKLMSQAGAAVRGFGADFGPALTGAAALGSLANTISPKLGEKIGSAVVSSIKLPLGPLKAVGAKIMAAIGVGVASAAGEEAIGNALGDAVTSGANAPSLLTKVKNAGGGLGKAFGFAMAAGVALGVAAIADAIDPMLDKLGQDFHDKLPDFLKAPGDWFSQQFGSPDDWPWPLGNKDAPDWARFNNDVDKGLAPAVQTVDQMRQDMVDHAAGIPRGVADSVAAGQGDVTAGAKTMASGIPGEVTAAGKDAANIGGKIPSWIGQKIIARQSEATDALATLRDLMKNELTPMQEIARDVGTLTSKELIKGLSDGRSGVRHEAERTRDIYEARVAEIIKKGGHAGREAQKALAKALKDKNPAVRHEAERIRNIINGKIDDIIPASGKAGSKAGTSLMQSFRRSVNSAGVVIIKVRTSDDTKGGRAVGGPVRKGEPWWVGERGPEIFVPKVDGTVLTASQSRSVQSGSMATPLGGGGDTINVNVPVTGILRAETPADLARPMRLLAASGAISNPRRRRRVEVPTRG